MEPLVRKAHEFAEKAHAGVFRQYTGEPYVEHVKRVAASVAALGFGPEVVAAAVLHDVIEDCEVSEAELAAEFSPKVAALVAEVSNPKIPKAPGNRPFRKAAEKAHLAGASYEGASIKLADMIDNSSNLAEHDPAFAQVYLSEMVSRAALVAHGHPELVARLQKNLQKYR